MNRKEWQKACEEGWAPRKYDNLSREIQQSLKYNPDPNATTRHHLMDTPEQIEYNTNHYEMWGHNPDGTFEYGKYMIFVTKEEHLKIHHLCEDTLNKISETLRMIWSDYNLRQRQSELIRNSMNNPQTRYRCSEAAKHRWENLDYRNAIIAYMKTRPITDEYREKCSLAQKKSYENNPSRKDTLRKLFSGESNPFYGKHHTEDSLNKMRKSLQNTWTKEKRQQASEIRLGENSPWYGKHHSDETKLKISNSKKGVPMSDEHKANWLTSIRSDKTRAKLSESHMGSKNPMYGKHPSDETRKKLSEAAKASRTDEVKLKIGNSSRDRMVKIKEAYSVYKQHGGKLLWNEFQKKYSATNGCVEVSDED